MASGVFEEEEGWKAKEKKAKGEKDDRLQWTDGEEEGGHVEGGKDVGVFEKGWLHKRGLWWAKIDGSQMFKGAE